MESHKTFYSQRFTAAVAPPENSDSPQEFLPNNQDNHVDNLVQWSALSGAGKNEAYIL